VSGKLRAIIDAPDGDVVLGVRPEDVEIVDGGTPARVRAVEPVGESGYLHLEVEGLSTETDSSSGGEGKKMPLLVASIAGRDAFAIREGATIEIALRTERCHLFDSKSGKRIGPTHSAPPVAK
jgi:ABC-type sugar transport system ATPase subunit